MVQGVTSCVKRFGRFFEIGFKAHDGGLRIRELGTEFLECNFEIPIFFFVFIYKGSVSGVLNERRMINPLDGRG